MFIAFIIGPFDRLAIPETENTPNVLLGWDISGEIILRMEIRSNDNGPLSIDLSEHWSMEQRKSSPYIDMGLFKIRSNEQEKLEQIYSNLLESSFL